MRANDSGTPGKRRGNTLLALGSSNVELEITSDTRRTHTPLRYGCDFVKAPIADSGAAVRTGLCIGIAGGAMEVAVSAFRHWALGRLLFVGNDYWWLTPLLSGAIVAVVSLIASLFVPRRPTLRNRVRFAIPLTLATLGVLWLFAGLAKPAALLLALGIGVVGGDYCRRHLERVDEIIRRSLPGLSLVPLCGGLLIHANDRWTFDRDSTGGPAGAPNVLLIVLDTVRAIELGLYGESPSTSPSLDALGRTGVVFDQAFSTAPWSAPSHASLFTGRRATELSIDWDRRLDGTYPTLAQELGRAGYNTVGMVANTAYTSAETGLARGFAWYEDYRPTLRRMLVMPSLTRALMDRRADRLHAPPMDGAGRIRAENITKRFEAWLDRHRGRPYFAFLNFYDAHAPYSAPEPFWSRFLPNEKQRAIPIGRLPGPMRDTAARSAYDAAIAHLDAEMGAMLGRLIARGLLDNTLVIVTADHGEEFNEHGASGHGQTLYTQAVRVPLVMFWPGHLPATRVWAPVSLARVPATIMDLAGVTGPFPGPSLAPLWQGGPVHSVAASSTVSIPQNGDAPGARSLNLASVQVGSYRYIRHPRNAGEELYDHAIDPLEQRNLVGTKQVDEIVRQLRDSLSAATSGRRARQGGTHEDGL